MRRTPRSEPSIGFRLSIDCPGILHVDLALYGASLSTSMSAQISSTIGGTTAVAQRRGEHVQECSSRS